MADDPDYILDPATGQWIKNPEVFGPDGKKLPDFGKAVGTFLTNRGDQPYGSHQAVGVKQGTEKANTTTWTEPTPEDMMKLLMRGFSGNISGKAAKRCAREGGTIQGIGPNCLTAVFKEDADASVAACVYDEVMKCIKTFQAAVKDATSLFVSTDAYNKGVVGRAGWGFAAVNAEASGDPAYANLYKKLALPRGQYIQAEMDFLNCTEKVNDTCECKRCVIKEGDYNPPGGGEDTEPPDPPDQTQTKYSDQWAALTTTSQIGNPIPRVWGRWVLAGNIIWTGSLENVVIDVVTETSGDDTTVTTDLNLFAEFSVGLCDGPVEAILRIFSDDVLLYTGVVDSTSPADEVSALDLAPFADSDTNLSSLTARLPTFRLYKGTPTQKVNPDAAAQEGFGRVPAYRDLCYVNFEHFNLSLVKGNFPNLRVDISTKTVTAQIPHEAGPEVTNLTPAYMYVDYATGLVYTRTSANQYVIHDLGTLGERYRGTMASNKLVGISNIGYMWGMRGNNELLINPFISAGKTLMSDNSAIDFGTTEFNGLLAQNFRYTYDTAQWDAMVITDKSNYVYYLSYDYSQNQYVFDGPITYDPVIPANTKKTFACAMGQQNAQLTYFQFLMNSSTQSSLTMLGYPVRGTNDDIKRYFQNDNFPDNPTWGQTQEITNFTFPASVWGGDTTGVHLQQVIYDASSNSFVLFLKLQTSSKYRIVKVKIGDSPAGSSVQWSVDCPYAFGNWSISNYSAAKSARSVFGFISTAGHMIKLDLVSGALSDQGALADYSAAPYAAGSAQCYDGRTDSILYISTSVGHQPKLARVYMGRAIADRVELAEIIQDIAKLSPSTAYILDTIAIEDITVGGYAVTDKITVADLLTEFDEFYQIAVIDDGAKIDLVPKGTLDVETTIAGDDDIITDTAQLATMTDASIPDTVQVSFSSLTTTGMDQNIQEVSVRSSDEETLRVPNIVSYTINVQDDASVMRRYAEVALEAARAAETTMSMSLMPKFLGLTPQDPVTYQGITYRLGTTSLGATNVNEIHGSIFDVDDYATQTSLVAATLDSGRSITGQIAPIPQFRPDVLFCNALNSTDALQSVNGKQVVYTAIQGDAVFSDQHVYFYTRPQLKYTPTTFGNQNMRVDQIDFSPMYVSRVHTRGAHYGDLIQAPNGFPGEPPFESMTPDANLTDYDPDSLIIQFGRADTIALLQNVDMPYDVLPDTPTRNLLIVGRELIQYGSFQVTDVATNTVKFTKLIRGVLGTEAYRVHTPVMPFFIADRCYLYTPETILPMVIDSSYTKRQNMGVAKLGTVVPAGSSPVEWIMKTDAGSSRPWPVTDLKVYSPDHDDQSALRISFKRRVPFIFNQMENLDSVADFWNSKTYMIETSNGFVYTTELFEGVSPTDAGPMYLEGPTFLFHEGVEDGQVVADFVFNHQMLEPPGFATTKSVLICQISRDENGDPVVGHPAVFYIAPPTKGTYPPLP